MTTAVAAIRIRQEKCGSRARRIAVGPTAIKNPVTGQVMLFIRLLLSSHQRARKKITATLESSEGWKRTPPIWIQRTASLTSLPTRSTARSSTTVPIRNRLENFFSR